MTTDPVFFPATDSRFLLAAAVRRTVFIEEQNCPENEEWDEYDATAIHGLIYHEGEPVGTLRFYDEGGWFHLGRLAVLPSARGLGLGGSMVAAAIREAKNRGFSRAFLHAQIDKVGLYSRHGFLPVGEEFMEVGIRHVRMEAPIGQPPK